MQTWKPNAWDECAVHYPKTPAREALLAGRHGLDATAEFCETWDAAPTERALEAPCVLVRGLFGRGMPGHFADAVHAARGGAITVPIPLADTSSAGAMAVAKTLRAVRHEALVVAHSKGGLDTLQALADAPALRSKVGALILVQTSHQASAVLAQIFAGAHAHAVGSRERWSNGVTRVGLRALRQHRGCEELADGTRDGERLALINAAAGVPVLSVVSWSCTPTAWLDSFHRRLGRIDPGAAHDGQFFVSQQVWPGVETVFLPALDHAQAVVGGGNFPARRFWRTLMHMGQRRLSAARANYHRLPA